MDTKQENKYDFRWVIALFGTAVGAGILFLPIRAGMAGFWPIIFMIMLILPMTWLSHRALSRFVTSSDSDKNIIDTSEDYFGKISAKVITFLYFFAIYPICLAYGVGITNTVQSFLVNQLGVEGIPRAVIAVVFISLMMLVMIKGKDIMMKVMQAMVYPLITVLFVFSAYLIPKWDFSTLAVMPSLKDLLIAIWLTLPVLVFAFNHSPAISSFSLELKKVYKQRADEKANKILFRSALMLTTFTMFFVISVVLTLSTDQLQEARSLNIPILSYIANIDSSSLVSFVVPVVGFTAIVSSFLGHYLGAHEGLRGIIEKYSNKEQDSKKVSKVSAWFIYITMIIVAIINPGILDMIETLGGPVIAVILFLMPMYAIYKVPSMHKYANKIADVFIVTTALVAISSIVYKLF